MTLFVQNAKQEKSKRSTLPPLRPLLCKIWRTTKEWRYRRTFNSEYRHAAADCVQDHYRYR